MKDKDLMIIQAAELKPTVRKAIKGCGTVLYNLEKILGLECGGHGYGFGGEDIDFRIDGVTTYLGWDGQTLTVNCDDDAETVSKDKVRKFLQKKLLAKPTKTKA